MPLNRRHISVYFAVNSFGDIPFAFPQYTLRYRQHQGQGQVWDDLRKKWLVLTGEEYVRQQLVQFILQEKKIGKGRVGIEREIHYHQLRKRFDMIIFDQEANPFILIECKAPNVKLSEQTLHRIARYNQVFQAPHLLLTNGPTLWFFSRNEEGKYDYQEKGWYEA